MERKIKPQPKVEIVVEEPVVETRKVFLYRKIGGGSLRLTLDGGKKIIKPGETFYAEENQIPKAFLDSLECLEESEKRTYENKKKLEIKKLDSPYFLVELEDGSWNVVNNEGKAINEKPLSKASAEELQNILAE